jgi:hypothetical protein
MTGHRLIPAVRANGRALKYALQPNRDDKEVIVAMGTPFNTLLQISKMTKSLFRRPSFGTEPPLNIHRHV